MGSHASTQKTKNLLIPSSSITTHKKSVSGEHRVVDDLDFKSQSCSLNQHLPVSTYPNFDSKEETFFDSQAWLDSDCDDDFRSVNGDFTPSRGSTSSTQGNSLQLPHQVDKYNFLDGATDFKPEPSPTDRKKRLSDLFQDRFADEDLADEQTNTANAKPEVKPSILNRLLSSRKSTKDGSSPYVSSPSRHVHHLEAGQKSAKSAACCLPGLIISRSFRERKNKSSPGLAVVAGA